MMEKSSRVQAERRKQVEYRQKGVNNRVYAKVVAYNTLVTYKSGG